MVRVRVPNLYKVVVTSLLLSVSCVGVFAQRNNPYAANPTVRGEPQDARPTIARQKPMTGSSRFQSSKPLTEIYLVGAGDVLFINLRNAPNAAGYYTVRSDGTIDFPLAGENPSVVHKTIEQIEDLLSAATTVYSNPLIEVRIREYASHKITVLGMAERVGETSLQREAMPLFAIRAQALVSPAATKANIRRGDLTTVEAYDLRDERTGDVLVYPGDSVEFTADGQPSPRTTISDGKATEPEILPGDMIEISN